MTPCWIVAAVSSDRSITVTSVLSPRNAGCWCRWLRWLSRPGYPRRATGADCRLWSANLARNSYFKTLLICRASSGRSAIALTFRDCLGAVEYEIDGKKELFFPGSESDYPLREMVVFLNDLRTAVDVRVLVASHDGTV